MALMVLCECLLSPRSAWTSQVQYDLGGACEKHSAWNGWKEIRDAEKSGDWDRVVALEKQAVRAGCDIEYRWFQLVNALLEAHQQTEASRALQEMDTRGFEVNPFLLGSDLREVEMFMQERVFKASPLGAKIKRLETISNARRSRFQEALNALPEGQRPPEQYIAEGVCPFECCRYGDWTVLDDTDLIAAPGTERVLGKAKKGTRVFAITGEVHLRPEPVEVLDDGELPKNTIAFVLDSEGEGYGHVYTRGKVISVSLEYAEYCFHPSPSCWGETLSPPSQRRQQVWWVKIRLANGLVGWTDKVQNFGGNDACG